LASIGLSSRKFTQEEYLFKFNVTEDVASGYIYDLIGGYQQKTIRIGITLEVDLLLESILVLAI